MADRVTYFVALPFDFGEDGDLYAGEAEECPMPGAAERKARRLALTHAGAVAFSRTGDPAEGEFEDAVVLSSVGEVLTLEAMLAS